MAKELKVKAFFDRFTKCDQQLSRLQANILLYCTHLSYAKGFICHVRKLSAILTAACACSSTIGKCVLKSLTTSQYVSLRTRCMLLPLWLADCLTQLLSLLITAIPCDMCMRSATLRPPHHTTTPHHTTPHHTTPHHTTPHHTTPHHTTPHHHLCLSACLPAHLPVCLSVCHPICHIHQAHLQLAHAGRARLLSILKPSEGGLLWRTAKADVADELGLPPQHQQTSSLQFSAIERHFYSRQHADCTSRASSTIPPQLLSQAAQGGPGGVVGHRRLTAAEEKKLLFPLLRLRQACCHPQVPLLLCCAVLCCAVPCRAVPCCAVLCCAVLCFSEA